MNYIKSLTLELIPIMLVAVISGGITGVGAYIAVRGDVIVLTVNQGIILDAIEEGSKLDKELYEGVKEHDVRLAVLESIQRNR